MTEKEIKFYAEKEKFRGTNLSMELWYFSVGNTQSNSEARSLYDHITAKLVKAKIENDYF
jgi:hypothetical protein